MVDESSLSQDLLNAIKLPNLKAIPAYLSEDDAITVADFMQSSYAHEYTIDTSNVHWGGETHFGHVFDIYANFSPMKDSVKVRLGMLQYVTAHQKRYNWNAHLYLRMNGMFLETWLQRMLFWDNGADALAIYAMSDMLGVHTTIITRHKPWTTIKGINNNINLDALNISGVILAYLGNNKFARVWKKDSLDNPSYIQQNYNYAPMVNPPAASTATDEDLETANTLLKLRGEGVPPELTLECPTVDATQEGYAMDKVVGHLDCNTTGCQMKHDFVDIIIQQDTPAKQLTLSGETDTMNAQCALLVETKIYSVKLVHLENILDNEIKRVAPSAASDLPVGIHFTRSKITPPNVRTGRKPRKANTGVQYDTNPESDSSAKSPRPVIKPKLFKPSHSGPSQARIDSHTKNSATPLVRLPAQKSNTTEPQPAIDDKSHAPHSQSSKQELDADDIPLSILRNQQRGTITIKEHVLERRKEWRKYKCHLCEASLPSCKALTKHHHDNHGIMYCDCCNKAFQNQRSLDKHMYVHQEKAHVCRVCGNKFPFERSQKDTVQDRYSTVPEQLTVRH